MRVPRVSIEAVRRADGSRVPVASGSGSFQPDGPGVYLVWLKTPEGIEMGKSIWY